MEIADSVSCDFYQSDNWDGREKSNFHIYEKGEVLGLEVETTAIRSDEETEQITKLRLDRLDIQTVEMIQSRLGEWLQENRDEEQSLKTRPVDGVYQANSEEQEIRRLQVDITRDGLRILALSSGDAPVTNAVRIPPTETVHDDETEDCEYLERLYSLLEIFLAGVEQESADIMRATRYLLNPETHFHNTLSEECLERYAIEDHAGVVQAAGSALEEVLKKQSPDDIVAESGGNSDLANRTFRENDPVYKWGYDDGEQKGLMFLYSGAFKALRNPSSHPRGDDDRNRFLDDINERDALDLLCFFNFLVRRLETYGITELERENS